MNRVWNGTGADDGRSWTILDEDGVALVTIGFLGGSGGGRAHKVGASSDTI